MYHFFGGGADVPDPPAMPEAPAADNSEAEAKAKDKKRRKARKKSSTLLSGPGGVNDEKVEKKTLLGA